MAHNLDFCREPSKIRHPSTRRPRGPLIEDFIEILGFWQSQRHHDIDFVSEDKPFWKYYLCTLQHISSARTSGTTLTKQRFHYFDSESWLGELLQ